MVADIRHPLEIPEDSQDFIICNSVIQHIDPQTVENMVLPSFARVLRRNGILLLIFKVGTGVMTIDDPHFQTSRSFRLYDEQEIRHWLSSLGLEPISYGKSTVDVIRIRDGKGVRHTAGYWRKS